MLVATPRTLYSEKIVWKIALFLTRLAQPFQEILTAPRRTEEQGVRISTLSRGPKT